MAVQVAAGKAFPLQMQYVLYADPLRVFDALTKKEFIDVWCDGGGSVTLPDGPVAFFGSWIKGEVVTAVRSRGLLSFTWKPSEWDAKVLPSLVEIRLVAHAAGTEIHVQHSGFPSAEEAAKHRNGWID
jgi:uncharacterized protein YndB with AHSA1/START domain